MDEREELRAAVPPLLEWFRRSKRDLPWRTQRTPYTALVAELMLQQTRVEAVKDRYNEFLRRFPTAESLAEGSATIPAPATCTRRRRSSRVRASLRHGWA